jgi:tol-pal system protein YbgF
MLHKSFLLLLLAVIFVLPACSSGAIGGSGSLQREIDALKMEVADLRERARLGGGSSMELDTLRTSVQRLTENVETASVGGMNIRQQLEYTSARLDRLEKRANLPPLSRDVVAPIPMVPAAVPSYPEPVQAPPAPVSGVEPEQGTGPVAMVPAPAPIAPEGIPAAQPAAPPTNRTIYDEGKLLFDQKNYSSAIERFKSYLGQEPNGNQVPAAQFYVGESYYFQNQFEEAILEYQTLISGYPKNNLVSTALLKQGLSFQALGDTASAKLIYQKVVREYPKSYSAGIARERLKTI